MNELSFPINYKGYAQDWNDWHVVREFMSNALDRDLAATLAIDDDTLVITNGGKPFLPEYLILGNGDTDENSRGMHHEGGKLGWLVLTKMGLTGHMRSGNLHFWNEPDEVLGSPTMKIKWEEIEPVDRTVFEVKGWEYPIYRNRFVIQNDPRIIFTDGIGRSILREEVPGFYRRNVWVCPAKSTYGSQMMAFGYDLYDLKLDRDRQVVDYWLTNSEVGKIWNSVEDMDLWVELFEKMQAGALEKQNSALGYRAEGKAIEVIKAAFEKAFNGAVLTTDDRAVKEAQYRGANTINLGNAATYLQSIVKTDIEFVEATDVFAVLPVADKELNSYQRKVLRGIRKAAERFGYNTITPCNFANPEEQGCWHEDMGICINVKALFNPEEAFYFMLHELAHKIYNTVDATAEHVQAVGMLAGQLLAPVYVRG